MVGEGLDPPFKVTETCFFKGIFEKILTIQKKYAMIDTRIDKTNKRFCLFKGEKINETDQFCSAEL